jgi:hypothetical protein
MKGKQNMLPGSVALHIQNVNFAGEEKPLKMQAFQSGEEINES